MSFVSLIARKFRRFTISGSPKIVVWRSTGGPELPLSTGVTVRKVGRDEVDEAASMDEPTTLEYLRRVMGQGYHMWFAYCDGIVVHRSLLLPGPASYHLWHSWATLNVPPADGLILGCATHPGYGGRGIYTSVLSMIANEVEWQGKWGFTETSNVASQRALIKAGFHPDHTLTVQAWRGFGTTKRGPA